MTRTFLTSLSWAFSHTRDSSKGGRDTAVLLGTFCESLLCHSQHLKLVTPSWP